MLRNRYLLAKLVETGSCIGRTLGILEPIKRETEEVIRAPSMKMKCFLI